jgi:DNA-directed RNA polymerase subunit alpha
VNHEFQSIDGVVEDVTEIVLNLKKVLIVSHKRETISLSVKATKAGAITAGDIQADANIQIVNPDQVICTLDSKRTFEAEIEIKTGRGYCPGEQNKKEEQPIGVIPIDSLFSPVRLVKYAVENTRVGQITDYDKLILEIWTDGRITPDDALKQAASILNHHLDVFDRVSEEAYEFESQQSEVSEEQNKLRKLLNMSVNEIELSVRAANCLNNANITTVGELAMKTEQEMLKYRNFGKKSLNEIKEKLEALGLSLGMKFDERLLDAKKEA